VLDCHWIFGLLPPKIPTSHSETIMRHSHQSSSLAMLDHHQRDLHLDSAQRLHMRRAGWIHVEAGMVWLTRDGGGVDHVLSPGERLWLGRGESAVVEPWQLGEAANLRWGAAEAVAQPARLARGLAGGVARALAAALRGVAGRLLLAARSAEVMANRAQGCISAGDSMASSGAVQ
jgi:hypothetical protein